MRASIAGLGLLIILGVAVPAAARFPPGAGLPRFPSPFPPRTLPPRPPVDLTLAFAGDLMGHEVNYRMPDFHDIYRGVQPVLPGQQPRV